MEYTVSEFIRCKNVVDHYFLCKNDAIKRAKRYRRWRNIMGTYKRGGYDNMPYKKPKKYKKSKKYKGKPVHQRLVAVGGAGTRYREKKNKDTGIVYAPATPSVTWSTPTLLNGIATGDDGQTRDGRKILIKSILVRWRLVNDAESNQGGSTVRVILFYDKQANNAAPAITDLLTSNTNVSPNNLANSERFVVLKDKIIGPYAGLTTGPGMGVFSVKTQMESIYGLTTDDITAINSGSVWITVAFDGGADFVSAVPTFEVSCRLRFVDV